MRHWRPAGRAALNDKRDRHFGLSIAITERSLKMESKQTDQANQQEVIIRLTEEQQKQIKRVTGKLVTELKVGAVEDRANPWIKAVQDG